MKNRLVMLVLVLIGLLPACHSTSEVDSFYIGSNELIELTKNVETNSESFIKKWGLQTCADGSSVSYYCLNTDMITYDTPREGEFIIGLTDISFSNFDQLILELSKTHQTRNKKELLEVSDFFRDSEFFKDKEIVELVMFYNEEYEIIIGKVEGKGVTSYSIVGAKK